MRYFDPPDADVRHPHPILGLAVADALGMPFETMTHDNPILAGWDGETFLACEHHGLRPGQWTDDTQMSLCLAESLIARGAYQVTDAAERYLAWFLSGTARGVGGTVRAALTELGKHGDPHLAGIVGGRGCGTAMRAIPLGVYARGGNGPYWNLANLERHAHRDARITHRSEEAEDASYIVASVASSLFHLVNNKYYTEELKDWSVTDRIQSVLMIYKHFNPDSVTYDLLTRSWAFTTDEEIRSLGTSSRASEVVATAMACLVNATSYEEAVVRAIRLGGDTDSRASIVGGWAAIVHPIPLAWVEGVENLPHLLDVEQRLLAASRPVQRETMTGVFFVAAPRYNTSPVSEGSKSTDDSPTGTSETSETIDTSVTPSISR